MQRAPATTVHAPVPTGTCDGSTARSDERGGSPDPRPVRSCVACRRPLPKPQLIRFAVVAGQVDVDARATQPGRGCYVCDRPECLTAALDKDGRRLRRALRGPGTRATVDTGRLRSAWRRAVGEDTGTAPSEICQ